MRSPPESFGNLFRLNHVKDKVATDIMHTFWLHHRTFSKSIDLRGILCYNPYPMTGKSSVNTIVLRVI